MDDIIDSMDMSLSKLQELVMDRKACHALDCSIGCLQPQYPWGCKESDTTESDTTELNCGDFCQNDASAGKESACSVGDLGSIPGLGRSPGDGNGYPLQFSGLENPRDCIVLGVSRSLTQLSNFHSCQIYIRVMKLLSGSKKHARI